MALRKASAYSRMKTRPYTRKSSVKSKSYVKAIPPQKIVKWHMGDISGFQKGKFNLLLRLVCLRNVQMRDNALEAARQSVHHELEENLLGQYYFSVRVYPHHILRENKMLTGAGADRMQTGMSQSFGTNEGRAALVKEGHDIFIVAISNEKAMRLARGFLEKIKAKMPCKTRIVMEKR